MAKQVIDIHPGKGMTVAQSNEHLRVAARGAYLSRMSNNFDPTREKLNFEVKRGGVITPLDKTNSIPKRIREILSKRKIKDPNRGMETPFYRTVANVILQGSREQMLRLAFGDQKVNLDKGADNTFIERKPEIEQWALDMYKFMSKRFGEENIAAFVVHLDETNPHIHCTLLPIVDNKISWRKFWIGDINDKRVYRQNMLKLHDELAKVNEKYGLERGEDITRTNARHRTTAEYRAELSQKLKAENIALADEITKKRTIRNKLDLEIIHAQARLKGLNTMIENLTKRQVDIQSEIEGLEKKLAEGKVSQQEYDKNMSALEAELENVKVNIADKQGKLQIAQEKLDALSSSIEQKEEHLEDVKKKLHDDKAALNRLSFLKAQGIQLSETTIGVQSRMQAYEDILKSLTPQQRNFIESVNNNSLLSEGSPIVELAQNGTDVAAIATNLFLGYLNNATDISQGGGGGAGPTSGWGKKDDEDEFAFWQRCFSMARKMKRSGPGRKR